ncbi:RING/U-box superfamily protein [Cinnamomum micranthum f. kanehirae]|uniref:RING/U-box superfamily protein n=1 Tax=Cinnamomum micranthum f. kanehirae TaxID=337451 RepID=A0A3S3PYY9_9MAGN|nr:RING/U-box superfamily protein [Cinnamomum micranthum f. kanehirae]
MAGMLPGVECARRRRFHQGGSTMDSQGSGTRRSSFCLYTSSHESHTGSNNPKQRSFRSQSFQTEKLGDVAREAKERLDERLKTQRKSESKRDKSTGNMGSKEENGGVKSAGSVMISSLFREVFSSKKKSSKKFSWTKPGGGKAPSDSDQEECMVCLEGFKSGELLVHLPCTHRYHSACLVPWLETSAHCPYCRTQVLT